MSKVLYCFASCVNNQALSYIRNAKTLKDAWGNLKKIFATSTITKNIQLRHDLSKVRQRDKSVVDNTSKIKKIYDSLTSINVNVEEDKMVHVCLRGLASKFGAF